MQYYDSPSFQNSLPSDDVGTRSPYWNLVSRVLYSLQGMCIHGHVGGWKGWRFYLEEDVDEINRIINTVYEVEKLLPNREYTPDTVKTEK